jgi:hypothetical protein
VNSGISLLKKNNHIEGASFYKAIKDCLIYSNSKIFNKSTSVGISKNGTIVSGTNHDKVIQTEKGFIKAQCLNLIGKKDKLMSLIYEDIQLLEKKAGSAISAIKVIQSNYVSNKELMEVLDKNKRSFLNNKEYVYFKKKLQEREVQTQSKINELTDTVKKLNATVVSLKEEVKFLKDSLRQMIQIGRALKEDKGVSKNEKK